MTTTHERLVAQVQEDATALTRLRMHRAWLLNAVEAAMLDLKENKPVNAYERLRLAKERIGEGS